jgi:hypothetical protein
MENTSSCEFCGSDNLEYINVDISPSIHCKDCNILKTKLTPEEYDETLKISSDN